MIKEYLLKIGYDEKYYKKIIKTPGVKDLKEDVLLYNICWNFVCLLELGYSRDDAIKITKKLPQIFGLTTDYIEKRFSDLVKLGYPKETVIKMTIRCPQLYSLDFERKIKKIYDDLIKMGYNDKQVLYITSLLPSIYTHSTETIMEIRKNIKSKGYSDEQVNLMTVQLPALFSMSCEKFNDRVGLLFDIGLGFIITLDTKQLIQSSKLTYARFCYLRDNRKPIDKKNYRRLFYDDKAFKRSFGVSNDEVLELYNYDRYLEERKKKNAKPL